MTLFLVTFLTLYGGLHIFAFFRYRRMFQPTQWKEKVLVAWCVVMTITPLFVRTAEQSGSKTMALFIAWPGYLWMGFIFIFTSMLLLSDLVRLVMNCFKLIFPVRARQYLSSQTVGKLVLFVSLGASVYAWHEASSIRSNHVVITSAKLPPSTPRIRIVQISDIHIGLLLQQHKLQQILEKLKEAHPDILVSTGDLVDGKLNRTDSISGLDSRATLLAAIPAPSGKFAIVGNHEIYAGLEQALAFTRASGFTVLRNQFIPLANGITVSGVDDQAINPNRRPSPGTETALLNRIDSRSFNLLLKHRPDLVPESDGKFDLQLSGHVHGGQIFPFNFLVKLKHSIPCGLTSTPGGSHIYVSRGTGTWGPPMRLFAPPEITIIDVVPLQRQPAKDNRPKVS